MRIRAVPAAVAGLALLAFSAWPAVSASAIPPPQPVLVADGGFDSAVDGVPSAWQCDADARIVPVYPPPAADFVHLVPTNDQGVPPILKLPRSTPVPTPAAGPTPVPPAPAADFVHTSPAVPAGTPSATPSATPPPAGQPASSGPQGLLWGTPRPDSRAECTQTVPVRPSTRYTLSAKVRGGQAFLGTEYGAAWTPPSAAFTTLTTTFTTSADAATVRVHLHGWYGGARYEADDVVLSGPLSTTAVPAAPAGLKVDRQTSSTVRLRWGAVPGVVGYQIQRDGVTVWSSLVPSAPVSGLTPGAAATLTVLACTGFGPCTPSAPLAVPPGPLSTQVPGTPAISGLRPAQAADGRIGILVNITPGQDTTDGYGVYVDDRLTGWTYGTQAFLPYPGGGRHTVEVTGLNSAGESPRSTPRTVLVPQA